MFSGNGDDSEIITGGEIASDRKSSLSGGEIASDRKSSLFINAIKSLVSALEVNSGGVFAIFVEIAINHAFL
jgi:hypothetical protein